MKPRERKDQITRAAVRCFAARGYHATQISDIIRKAKVARGTFYLYFKSKHDIFNIILDEFIAHLGCQIRTIELNSEKSPAEQMRENVKRVVDVILNQPELAKIIFNEAVGLDWQVDKRLKDFYARLINIVGSSIRKGISLGLVRSVHPDTAACIVLGGFREIIVQNGIFKNTKIGRERMIGGLIDVLLGGLGAKSVLV